ncbi:CgeB family protein [Roseicyclus sp.]|uniref:CgeB family protein n=1 Tax=Roseicyclus sp. TaxID=1914329 RepID=UPI003FA07024
MRFVFYTHSLVSDWNHGNAHFLRGVMRELLARGHEAIALEPENGWSRAMLRAEAGQGAEEAFARDFPCLTSRTYGAGFDHAAALDGADVVVVHEWTEPDLVARIGRLRRDMRFTLLFHDTHHRAVTSEPQIADLALGDYDGVLAFGEALRERYLAQGWGRQVFTWHEAADTRLFRPMPGEPPEGDLVWVGNWGDGERSAELETFLVRPVEALGLTATVRGVRYPEDALVRLRQAGIGYGGWVRNAAVPRLFARPRVAVHVPRRPYVEALPGIPTIRPFEALACGIPLVSAPWDDAEGLFRPGRDFLYARGGAEMAAQLARVLADPDLAADLAASGLETVRARHTCAHRVDELTGILGTLGAEAAAIGEAAE